MGTFLSQCSGKKGGREGGTAAVPVDVTVFE